MMNRSRNTVVSLALAVSLGWMLSGCATDSQKGHPETQDAQAGPTLAEPVQLLGKRSGDQGDLPHAGVWLIRTQEDLLAAGSATIGELGVDLVEHDIVIVGLGQQPTGGHAIDICAVQQVGQTLFVQGSVTEPAADAATTQALTNPWCAVVIANTSATSAHCDIE